MNGSILLCGTLLFCTCAVAQDRQEEQGAEQAAAITEPPQTVVVSSIRDPALQPYRRMVRGLDAWDANRALAPTASLRFELWTADGRVADVNGLKLHLSGDRLNMEIPIDADATFVLPRSQEAYDDNADLVANKKSGQIRWRPRVRTPGVPEGTRRLGDLRLECRVSTAVRHEEIPFLHRAAALAAGGICNMPMAVFTYRAPQRLAAATLVSGERRVALKLHDNGAGYQVPLRDKSWSNEAVVMYEFAGSTAAGNQ